MESMVPVAVSEGVTIFCSRDGKFSFFNSPFPAHILSTGVDLYPKRNVGEMAPSPVEGRVLKIRKIKCPGGRGFRASGFDYLILLRSLENSERIVKILHVSPVIQCGEVVEAGQDMGRLLRSGYFNYWTEPHIHLEVRPPSDPLRARGGFTLNTLIGVDETAQVEELRGVVTENRPEYSLVNLDGGFVHGLPVDVGGERGLLDGGVPHYGFVGVHMRGASSQGSPVRLCGKPIATVKSVYGNTCLAECTGSRIRADGVTVGLSLYLFPASKPEVKLVPPKLGALKLEESNEISLFIG